MEEILIFGHRNPDTDSIMATIVEHDFETKKGDIKTKPCRIGKINKETEYALKYFGLQEPELIDKAEKGTKVILVDHCGYGQSIEGRENAEIVKVIDHHNISGIETAGPLFYLALPLGSTCTILYYMYKVNNMNIEPKIAGAMLSAIISDTLLLKSPTCTNKDKEAAKELANIANVDINKYGLDMLKAGAKVDGMTPEQLINIDSKEYNTQGIKYQVAQINTVDIKDVLTQEEGIKKAIQEFIDKNNIQMYILMITDILENNSQIIVLGKRVDIVEKAFNIKLEKDMAFLPGVVSRKKEIIPIIENNL